MTKPEHDFKRVHKRKMYGAEIIFGYKDRAYSGNIKDISLGGAFIITSSVDLFSPGDIITVSIPFTTGNQNVKRRGRIKWMNNEGFAIEFL